MGWLASAVLKAAPSTHCGVAVAARPRIEGMGQEMRMLRRQSDHSLCDIYLKVAQGPIDKPNEQSHDEHGEQVAAVRPGGDQRYRGHLSVAGDGRGYIFVVIVQRLEIEFKPKRDTNLPVVAERGGTEHEPPVEGGQVGEGKEPGDNTGMVRSRIILLREFRQWAAYGDSC